MIYKPYNPTQCSSEEKSDELYKIITLFSIILCLLLNGLYICKIKDNLNESNNDLLCILRVIYSISFFRIVFYNFDDIKLFFMRHFIYESIFAFLLLILPL